MPRTGIADLPLHGGAAPRWLFERMVRLSRPLVTLRVLPRLLLANRTLPLEIAMLYYWWLYSVMAPLVALDMLLRASPLYPGAWPLGMDYLARDY